MHALLIILGNDIKIREVVENDKERMVEMLTRISYHCNVLTTIMESKGASEGAISKGFLSEGSASKPETTIQGIIRSEQVIEWLENLNPNPEDIVLVYYAGHGEIGPSALLFDSGSNGNDTLDRKTLSQKLEEKPARLRMLITDGSSFMEGKTGDTSDATNGPSTDSKPKVRLKGIVNLFFGHTGFLDITAASPGQKSWGTIREGGLFTYAFVSQVCETVRDVNEDGFISWEEAFAAVVSETELTLKQIQMQMTQTPKAYSLPTPVRP